MFLELDKNKFKEVSFLCSRNGQDLFMTVIRVTSPAPASHYLWGDNFIIVLFWVIMLNDGVQ